MILFARTPDFSSKTSTAARWRTIWKEQKFFFFGLQKHPQLVSQVRTANGTTTVYTQTNERTMESGQNERNKDKPFPIVGPVADLSACTPWAYIFRPEFVPHFMTIR